MENIKPIRNDADLDWAINEVAQYFENEPKLGSPEADRFDLLSDLIESYEGKYHPIEAPDPVELIQYFMDAHGFTRKDLGDVIGSAPRATEVMKRKRHLSIGMVRCLHKEWKIPAERLIEPYHLIAAE